MLISEGPLLFCMAIIAEIIHCGRNLEVLEDPAVWVMAALAIHPPFPDWVVGGKTSLNQFVRVTIIAELWGRFSQESLLSLMWAMAIGANYIIQCVFTSSPLHDRLVGVAGQAYPCLLHGRHLFEAPYLSFIASTLYM